MGNVYTILKGRIGNVMFQIAAATSLAYRMKTNCKAYILPTYWTSKPDNCFLPTYLESYKNNVLNKIVFIEKLPPQYVLCQETEFSYNELPEIDNVCLSGYFQSEKYFNKPLVRDLFRMDKDMELYLNEKYHQLLLLHPVSVNVRRGDYLDLQDFHPVCSFSFFKEAMGILGVDRHYLITSDDVSWCKQNFTMPNCHVVEDLSPIENLYLQSLCYDHIISNSTYSWWGAWLDEKKDKRVICPKKWFGPRLNHQNTKDLLPEDWIQI